MRSCRKKYFHFSYHRSMPGTLVTWQPSIGDACQSGKMTILLYSLFFVCLKCRFCKTTMSNIMITKCCIHVSCNWFASLDVAEISALANQSVGLYSRGHIRVQFWPSPLVPVFTRAHVRSLGVDAFGVLSACRRSVHALIPV